MTYGNYVVDYEQRAYNPERMRKYRLERAHAALKKHGFGAMLFFDFDNFRYLGYCHRHNYKRRRPHDYLLLIRDNGYPYCPADRCPPTLETEWMPWLEGRLILNKQTPVESGLSLDDEYTAGRWVKQAEEVKSLLNEHGVADEPVGIDAHFGLQFVDACRKAGINIVDGNKAMAEARMIKNEDEIECCRIAGSITESAHWEVCKALRPGIMEWKVAGVAAKALYDLGAEELEGPSFVGRSGPRSGHGPLSMFHTDRVIRPGELYIMDINGVSFQGYRTCFYRTYCVGDKPTEFQKQLYRDCYEIQRSMETNIKPGITSHDYARAVLKEGKGKWPGSTWPNPGRYFAATGHQLGLASGDPGPTLGQIPAILEQPPFTIQKGMVFALEVWTGAWDGKQWAYDGVKIENVGAVTDTGFEILYRFPYKDLITVGLPGVY